MTAVMASRVVNGGPWRRRALLAAAVAAVMAFSFFWGRRHEPPRPALDGRRVSLLVGATEPAERVRGRAPYWRIRRGDETLYAGETAVLAPDVRGYGGPFNLLVVIDGQGSFERVVLLEHRETPSYLSDLRDFFASFVGASAGAPLEAGRDVDAITRATVSSRAFATAARVAGRKVANAALGTSFPVEERVAPWDWRWALGVAAFFVAAAWARRRAPRLLRLGLLAAAVGVLGFWGGRFVAIGDVGRLVLWKFPPWGERLSLYALLLGGAGLALFFGNLYCGWLCPFGAVTEILYEIPVPKLTAPPAFARRLSAGRVVVLGAVVAVVVATRRLGVAAYEPFDDLFAFAAAGWSLLFLVGVLAASAFHYRFFCRYLCAAGALLGEFAAAGRRERVTGCKECGDCVAACPAGAIVSRRGDVDRSLCFECGRCRRACRADDAAAAGGE